MEIDARQLMEAAGSKTVFNNSYAGACINKWNDLLQPMHENDPIRDPYIKKCTAVLLENEMDHVKELKEDTLSTDTGYFTKYVFPILRRVFPNLIANQLVSVQPMTSPVSAVFYYDKKYDNRKGTKIPQGGISNQPYSVGYDGELAAGDEINKNFAKYYSSEFIDYDVTCTDTGTATATLNQGSTNCRTTNWSPIRANGTSGQRTFTVKAYYQMADADAAGAQTAVIATMDGSGNLIDDANSNTVGTFAIASGNWSITPAGTGGTASNFWNTTAVYFQYYVNWELVYQNAGSAIPSVSLEMTLHEIRAESRNLKAKWTTNAVHDLRALHGMDAETELVSTFSNEVLLEVDREIVTDLVNGAAHQISYTYSSTVPGEIESIRQMITQIGAVAAAIHRTSGRAPANFLVVSPSVGSLLDQLSTHGDYASIEQNIQSPSYGLTNSNFGIARIGTLLKKYAVFQDPYITENQILIGLKGNNFLDSGYVYAPYVPLYVTPTFLDPDDFTFRKGAQTRYATKMLRPEYYGVMTVSGLPSVTTTIP